MFTVAIGGFFGAVCRFQISEWIHVKFNKEKYIATFLINCIGSLLLGFVIGESYSNFAIQLIAIGFLGSFTTFSTFSFEVVKLLEEKRVQAAIYYVVGSSVVSIIFAAFGYIFLTGSD